MHWKIEKNNKTHSWRKAVAMGPWGSYGCYQTCCDCGHLRTDNMSLFSSFHKCDSVWSSPDTAVSQRSLRRFERQDYNLRKTSLWLPPWSEDGPCIFSRPTEDRRHCLCACLHQWIWKNLCEVPTMEILFWSHESITPTKLGWVNPACVCEKNEKSSQSQTVSF